MASGAELAVAAFGAALKGKLSNAGAAGSPEDQLRNPLEILIRALGEAAGLDRDDMTSSAK